MKIYSIFYILGIVFAFAAATYFSLEYLKSLSSVVKAILIFCASAIFFFLGDYLTDRGI